MTANDIEVFKKFLEESFENDIVARELRLSNEEVKYLKKIYPRASVRKMPFSKCSDGKLWFEVRLVD